MDSLAGESDEKRVISQLDKQFLEFRNAKRSLNIERLDALIEIALKKSKMTNRPIAERQHWMEMVGKLILYQDRVLSNSQHEQGKADWRVLEKALHDALET